MDRGLYVAASGALSQQRVLDTATSNLSSANVSGFKKDFPIFEMTEANQGYPLKSPMKQSSYNSEMTFVESNSLQTDYSQGGLSKTGGNLDFAIYGRGFMVVEAQDPGSGGSGTYYTRNGHFYLNADGDLITSQGHQVMGEGGAINLQGTAIEVDKDGNIFEDGALVDKLKVVELREPYSIKKVGGGLYAGDKKGSVELPAEDSVVHHGHLEQSNAKAVEEMVKMITALRAYESNMKLIGSFDSITEKAITLAK